MFQGRVTATLRSAHRKLLFEPPTRITGVLRHLMPVSHLTEVDNQIPEIAAMKALHSCAKKNCFASFHLMQGQNRRDMSMSTLRTSYIGNTYYKILQNHLLLPIQRIGLTPDQLTMIGVALAVLVPFGFMLHPALGCLFIMTSGLADSLDGLMARCQQRSSTFGAFLDSTIDRVSDFFYLSGFWLLLWSHPQRLSATLLMLAALLLTLMISYVKARAESLGAACQVGLMDRAARVAYLIAWAFLIAVIPGTFAIWIGFLIYIILAVATVVHRIIHVRQQLLPSHRSTL